MGSSTNTTGGGQGGNGTPTPPKTYKVSKVMLWPSRKINLGNYSSADLNAGIELTFDKPVATDSKELQDALDDARKVIRDEFKKQLEPYRKIIEQNKDK